MPEAGETPARSAAQMIVAVLHILDKLLGFGRSAREGVSVLGDGTPVPMMSYSIVEYLMSLDLRDMDILEAGGGQSTLFWAARARSVVTLEHDPRWMPDIAALTNITLVPVAQDAFPQAIRAQPGPFDLIVLDCAASRYDCAIASIGRLRAGGAILLDNSDWYPNTTAWLRAQDLIQVDFADFRPLHRVRAVSSLFLHRDFRPVPLAEVLPPIPIGGIDRASRNGWDGPGVSAP